MNERKENIIMSAIILMAGLCALGVLYALLHFIVSAIGVRGLVSLMIAVILVVLLMAALMDERR